MTVFFPLLSLLMYGIRGVFTRNTHISQEELARGKYSWYRLAMEYTSGELRPSPGEVRWSKKTSGDWGYVDGAAKVTTKIGPFSTELDFWIEPNEIKFLREFANKAEAWLALSEEERKLRGKKRK